jgi:hypothetical protein
MINIRTELLYAPNYYWEWLIEKALIEAGLSPQDARALASYDQ